MGNRIKRIGFVMVLVLVFVFSMTANAQTVVNKEFMVEQAKGKAPNVKLYVTGTKVLKDVTVTGTDDTIEFVQAGNIEGFKESEEGIRYIILMDNSGSIDRAQFEEAKLQLSEWRKSLKPQDEMELYTVGTLDILSEKVNVFGRTVLGTDTAKLESDMDAIVNVPYMKDAAGKTILYRSLSETLEAQESKTSYDSLRTVVILITDGEDDSDEINGKDNDNASTLKNVQESTIPIYGIVLNNKMRSKNEEKIKFTKNRILNSDNSRGYYYNCATEPTTEVVDDAFKQIKSILYDNTYIINLKADNNRKISGMSELQVLVDGQSKDVAVLDYSEYEMDSDAPSVVGSLKKDGKNVVKIVLEDENGINIADAKDKSHYTVIVDDGKKKATKWKVAQVSATENGNQAIVNLTMEQEEFYNQKYKVTIDGIHDNSEDQNKMNKVKASFTVEDGLNPTTQAIKNFILKYWWIAFLIVVIGVGVAVVIIVKKKTVKIVESNTDELVKADSKLIRLTITDRTGAIKDVEWDVEGSLFVGRSDICNIFFDDDRLSRQHFVIEVTKMGCYLNDLETTNGTFVNGVRITTRRLLLDGDVITAGREKIVFHMDRNQVYGEE